MRSCSSIFKKAATCALIASFLPAIHADSEPQNITIYNISQYNLQVCTLNDVHVASLQPHECVTVDTPQVTRVTNPTWVRKGPDVYTDGKKPSFTDVAGGYIIRTVRTPSKPLTTVITAPASYDEYAITAGSFVLNASRAQKNSHKGFTEIPARSDDEIRNDFLIISPREERILDHDELRSAKDVHTTFFVNNYTGCDGLRILDKNGMLIIELNKNECTQLPYPHHNKFALFNLFNTCGGYIVQLEVDGKISSCSVDANSFTSAEKRLRRCGGGFETYNIIRGCPQNDLHAAVRPLGWTKYLPGGTGIHEGKWLQVPNKTNNAVPQGSRLEGQPSVQRLPQQQSNQSY